MLGNATVLEFATITDLCTIKHACRRLDLHKSVLQTYERGGGGPFKRERVACNWGFKDAQGNLLPVHDSCEAEFLSGALEDAILEGMLIFYCS